MPLVVLKAYVTETNDTPRGSNNHQLHEIRQRAGQPVNLVDNTVSTCLRGCQRADAAHLNKVARQLNERPRETLAFQTPADGFNACAASIA